MSSIFDIRPIKKHMKVLCDQLGPKYKICVVDFEQVIYRDFGNGFNVEISGANTSSLTKRVTIFLWKGNASVVKTISDVPQCDIGDRVEELFYESQNMI